MMAKDSDIFVCNTAITIRYILLLRNIELKTVTALGKSFVSTYTRDPWIKMLIINFDNGCLSH